MTVEPSYAIKDESVYWPPIQALLDNGTLVPDTRLQAITDAWNGGSTAEPALSHRHSTRRLMPELAGLLDALTEEND